MCYLISQIQETQLIQQDCVSWNVLPIVFDHDLQAFLRHALKKCVAANQPTGTGLDKQEDIGQVQAQSDCISYHLVLPEAGGGTWQEENN